jgi:hypothetical protein
MRKSPSITIQETGGEQFPDLESAQRAALPQFAGYLQSIIKDLLDQGALMNVDGKIIPAPTPEQV